MTSLNRHKLFSLEIKIQSLDMLKNYIAIVEICSKLNIPRRYLDYWKNIESKLRLEFEFTKDIERLEAAIHGPNDACKYDEIVEKLSMIEKLYKKNMTCMDEKIFCLDLLSIMHNKFSRVSSFTGFSTTSIHAWKNNEVQLRTMAEKQDKMSIVRIHRKKTEHILKTETERPSAVTKRTDISAQELVNKKRKIDYSDDDKRLNGRRYTYGLRVKIDALNMIECGATLSYISQVKHIPATTIGYWSKKNKEWTDRKVPLELKLKIVDYLRRSRFHYSVVGDVFGYSRHSVRYFSMQEKDIRQTLATRDEKRRQRLQSLLTLGNYRLELTKLNKLCDSPDPLSLLDEYLTAGTINMGTVGGAIRLKRSKIVTPRMEYINDIKRRRDELILSGVSPDMKELFCELFTKEYNLLLHIDRRHTFLDHGVQSGIDELHTNLLFSLRRLILLHQMLIKD